VPSGFVGSASLIVRIRYNTGLATWQWIDYRSADADARYLLRAQLVNSIASSSAVDPASANAAKLAYDKGATAQASADALAVTVANLEAAIALRYTVVADVASIPAGINGLRIEITNTTNIQSFSPLTGRPSGFIGSAFLSARLVYSSIGSTWQWFDYRPFDPDSRYGSAASVATAQTTADNASSAAANAQTTATNAAAAAATAQTRADRAPALETVKGTVSGSSIDFAGIPSWVKRVSLMLNGVSQSVAQDILVQLGVGASPTTSGYTNSQSVIAFTSGGTTVTTSSAGIPIFNALSTYVISGRLVIERYDPLSNTWLASGLFTSTAGAVGSIISTGIISLSGALGMVRLTTVAGTATFDLGSINIMYE